MITAGIDVGSTAAKTVILNDKTILGWAVLPTGWSPQKAGEKVLDKAMTMAGVNAAAVERVVGTGYGRVSLDFLNKAATEITCHAMGANYYFPIMAWLLILVGRTVK